MRLLANPLATGAALIALILALAPVSGAHMSLVVTLVAAGRREIGGIDAIRYVAVQIFGGITGTLAAHAMFGLALVSAYTSPRAGAAQLFSEIATLGLVVVIWGAARRGQAVAAAVGCYIVAAHWFTASTSFANPAVTIGRAFTSTFAGIRTARRVHTHAFMILHSWERCVPRQPRE